MNTISRSDTEHRTDKQYDRARPVAVVSALRHESLAEYLLCVCLHLYLLRPDDACHHSILIGKKGSAEHAHDRLAIHLLLAIHAKGLNESMVGVADEREGKVVLLYEPLVRLGILRAHTNDGVALGLQPLVIVS